MQFVDDTTMIKHCVQNPMYFYSLGLNTVGFNVLKTKDKSRKNKKEIGLYDCSQPDPHKFMQWSQAQKLKMICASMP